MKKTYLIPQATAIRLDVSPLLNISGGGQGNEGDIAESKRFWGSTILDDEEQLETDVDVDWADNANTLFAAVDTRSVNGCFSLVVMYNSESVL